MEIKKILMIKFYVVDGISYPAAETAVGFFGGHGYKSMAVCREVGVKNAKFKGSMNIVDLLSFINTLNKNDNVIEISDIDIDPNEYYLKNNGFGVYVDEVELFMAEKYLVNSIPYTKTEELAKIVGKKGFEAMYAVCKLGGFYGAKNKGSMTKEDFHKRKEILKV